MGEREADTDRYMYTDEGEKKEDEQNGREDVWDGGWVDGWIERFIDRKSAR